MKRRKKLKKSPLHKKNDHHKNHKMETEVMNVAKSGDNNILIVDHNPQICLLTQQIFDNLEYKSKRDDVADNTEEVIDSEINDNGNHCNLHIGDLDEEIDNEELKKGKQQQLEVIPDCIANYLLDDHAVPLNLNKLARFKAFTRRNKLLRMKIDAIDYRIIRNSSSDSPSPAIDDKITQSDATTKSEDEDSKTDDYAPNKETTNVINKPSYESNGSRGKSRVPLCRFYGSARGCRFGDNCLDDHSNPNSILLCQFHNSRHGCLAGSHCEFRHEEFESKSADTKTKDIISTPGPFNRNPLNIITPWNQIRRQLCKFHGSARGCRYGNKCTDSHQNPNSIAICRHHFRKYGCGFGAYCRHRHEEFECKSSNCYQIKRILAALIFYSIIDPIHRKKDRSKFMEYFNDEYPEFLDDYTHIMEYHQNDIEQTLQNTIKSDLNLMDDCNAQNCVIIRRYSRDRRRDKIKSFRCDECTSLMIEDSASNHCQACFDLSKNLVFYIDLLDSTHCHWFHSFDLGLRRRSVDIQYANNDSLTEMAWIAPKQNKLINYRVNNKTFLLAMTDATKNPSGI